jgi:hypothetical protein
MLLKGNVDLLSDIALDIACSSAESTTERRAKKQNG